MGRIEVIKNTDKELIINIADEDYTMGNLIAKLAEAKPEVVYSAYRIDHPLIPKLTLTIITDGSRAPIEVLKEVLNDISRMAKEFQEKFKEALNIE